MTRYHSHWLFLLMQAIGVMEEARAGVRRGGIDTLQKGSSYPGAISATLSLPLLIDWR